MSLNILGKLVEPIDIELRPILIVFQSSRRGAYIFVSSIHTLIYMLYHIANSSILQLVNRFATYKDYLRNEC